MYKNVFLQKLPGYTIIEVTVAMLLAAVSIGISYTAYSMIARSYISFDQKNKKVSELLLVDKLLKQDVDACNQIVRTDVGFIFQMKIGEIEYRFENNYIIRDQYRFHIDTLHLINSQLLSTFENKESFAGEVVDKITFNIHEDEKSIPLMYVKQYSAEELFE